MINLRPNKYILRILVIFFVYLPFIIGDSSIGILEFSWRKILFSILFFSYWLIVWFIAEYFTNIIHKKQARSSDNKTIYNYLLFFINLVFASIAGFGFNLLYRSLDIHFFQGYDRWSDIPIFNPELTMSLFSIYMLIFTADIYFYAILEKKEGQIKMEKIKRENMKAQYLVLKSQLDPHFLFNSLSVLSSLIHTDVKKGDEFILRLSKTLRYFIEKKEMILIPLKDEIAFVNDYLFLIKCRFENEIHFENTISQDVVSKAYVPPASLQLLIENAIKHNKFSSEKPLKIQAFNENNHLVIANNIDLRDDIVNTTKQGIQNLTQRFAFFKNDPVNIEIDNSVFKVTMPILTITDYERFNS